MLVGSLPFFKKMDLDVFVVPVSINYERIVEGSHVATEFDSRERFKPLDFY